MKHESEMKHMDIPATAHTPAVSFIPKKGTLNISGRSFSENSDEFYEPIIDALDHYAQQPQIETVVSISLEYFNTSTSRRLLALFKTLENMVENGQTVTVNWYFSLGDTDMLDAGNDYRDMTGLPFKLIETTSTAL